MRQIKKQTGFKNQ